MACFGNRQTGTYLIQKELYERPKLKNWQNLIKLEIHISNANFGENKTLNYRLHLVVRLVKVMYVDYQQFGKIGEQQFYVLPNFYRAQLSEMYEQRARSQN